MDRLEELRQRFANEPLGKLLGATLDDLRDGYAVVSAKVLDGFLIVGGTVQGGVTTMIADFAGVYAAMSKLPIGHTPAMHISIDFLRPIKKGDVIRAVGHVENESKTFILVHIDVYGSDQKRKAYATARFFQPKA